MGIRGQTREPGVSARERRNSQAWTGETLPFLTGSAISVDGNGRLTINVGNGIEISSEELVTVVQGVLGLDGSGIKLNFNDPFFDNAGNLDLRLDDEFLINGSSQLALNLAAPLTKSGGPLGLNVGPGLQTASSQITLDISGLPTATAVEPANDTLAVYDDSESEHRGLGVDELPGTKNLVRQVRTVTSDTTLTQDDEMVFADTQAGGDITLTLPAASNMQGRSLQILRGLDDTKTLTLDPGGDPLIGNPTQLTAQVDSVILVSDGTTWFVVSGSYSPGNLMLTKGPQGELFMRAGERCLVEQTSVQSISNNSETAVNYQNVIDDPANVFDGSTDITINDDFGAGVYMIQGTVHWADGSANHGALLKKNGNDLSESWLNTGLGYTDTQQVTAIDRGVVGDTYRLNLFQNSGSAINTDTGPPPCSLSIVRIAAFIL